MKRIIRFLGKYLAFEVALFNILAIGIFFEDKGRRSSLSLGCKFFGHLFGLSFPIPRIEHYDEEKAIHV